MPARSKYRAVPTVLDGERFHSKAEAARWAELKLLERVGKISDLKRQVSFALNVGTKRIGRYVTDFVYRDEGVTIFEDYKGIDNRLSRWKRKHVEAEYGIRVRLTGAAAKKRAA